jgi:hypothetical protein
LSLPLAALAAAPPASDTDPRGPRIALEPAHIDFGRVLQGRTLTRQILIRNLGDQDLLIEGVKSTCDCALALPESRRIPPGRSAPLRVRLETRATRGRLVRSLQVKSNDPTQASVELSLEATSVPAKGADDRPLP